MNKTRFDRLQRDLAEIQKRTNARPPEPPGQTMRKRFQHIQSVIREACERDRLKALELAEERERQRREALKRARLEEERQRENERREKIRENPHPIKPRKFQDKRVTVLHALFLDCFPEGGGFTCNGHWVDEGLSERARLVLQPCFDGEPEFEALSTRILKLIHADVGDDRLSVDERTEVFQLFYQSCVNTRKTQPKQEDTICL
jgi:hypothetical protein|tara:strand:+ start:4643 stop:5254 length:612 start_codon:yes stop_codon:yes gene_type:complete